MFFFHPRTLSQTYGLQDTVRVDGGKEFNLLVFIQQFLSHTRTDTSRLPIRRGRSTDISCFIFHNFKFQLLILMKLVLSQLAVPFSWFHSIGYFVRPSRYKSCGRTFCFFQNSNFSYSISHYSQFLICADFQKNVQQQVKGELKMIVFLFQLKI